MSDVATLIADMVRAGVDPDIIGRTAAALTAREPVQIVDAQAERRREADRNRKSAKRLRNSAESADTVSPKKEIPPTPPKEKTTPSETQAKACSGCDEKFAEFWLAYPRRDGPNPRKPAKLVFDRLVAKGADPERLIAAAQALAVENPTPTRFIPQAVTWLNQERFGDVDPVIAGDTFCPEDNQTTKLHVLRHRNEHSGLDPPRAIQGGKAGYMIPTTWVKSMQMRQANG